MAESTTGTSSGNSSGNSSGTHRAGLFDIRVIIAALIGLYGIITFLTGLFASDAQINKADGLNINLTAGIGMIVVAIGFGVWAKVRPIVVPDQVEQDTTD